MYTPARANRTPSQRMLFVLVEKGDDEAGHDGRPEQIAQQQQSATTEAVAQCADGIRGGRVEHVPQGVEQGGDLGGRHGAVAGGQELRGRQNQQRVGEIARPKHAHAHQKTAKAALAGARMEVQNLIS